jgi:hypothetical protein
VDLFALVHWGLLAIAVTTIWPLNIPLTALAYKVRRGNKPVDLEPSEFWVRSTFAALGLSLFTLVAVGLDYLLVVWMELASIAGPIRLVLFMLYVPAAVVYLAWMFGRDDLLDGLPLFLLSTFLPWLALFVFVFLPLYVIGLVFSPARRLLGHALNLLVLLKEFLFP